MPTFTETKQVINNNMGAISGIEASINQEKDLGKGYKSRIEFLSEVQKVRVFLLGKEKAVNDIPDSVLIKHASVLKKVKRWMNDLEVDFPTL